MLGTVPWASDLRAIVGAHGDRVAVHDGVNGLTFRAMAGRATQLAGVLAAHGVTPGTPVATSLRNTLPAVWTAVGLRIAGAADTALNATYTEAERRHALTLSGARLVVTTEAQAAAFRDLGCDVVTVESVANAPAGDLAALPPVSAAAWGRVGFTSGTTGAPKAIITTHGARFIANILQRADWSTMPGPGSRVLLMTPFVHGAGLLTQAFNDCGATAVLLDGVDLTVIARLLDDRAVDHIFAPPTVLAKIVGAFEGQRFDFVRTIFCGTAPLTRALYEKARAMFGPVVRVTYGKSEITNPIAVLQPAETEAYYAEPAQEGVCVGFAGTGVEVQVRAEDGRVCVAGTTGEVYLRGRHMSLGYKDAGGFHPWPDDGFHPTGDLGQIDAAERLHLVGRLADVIKSGGYKIHPDEIEQVLAGSAGTGAVAIVSLPSEYWGEVIVAVAETDDPSWPDRARASLETLSRHKHPRAFLIMGELARNKQGKIMRRLIREAVMEEYRLIDGPRPVLDRR